MQNSESVISTDPVHDCTTRPYEIHTGRCMTSLDIDIYDEKPSQLTKLKLYLFLLCASSIGYILLFELNPRSLFFEFRHPVSKMNLAYSKIETNQEVECQLDLNSLVMNHTLNITTPEWTELMQEYIPIDSTQRKWTVIKVNQTQNGWNNSNTEMNNNTTSIQNGSEPLLVLVDRNLAFWSPMDCDPAVSIAIIIPYRNREEHLRVLLHNLPSFLIRQKVQFTIFIVEQMASTRFNRALLMNIGFRESSRVSHFDCFIFHDVDLMPEDPRTPYACSPQPVHLSAAIDQHNYRLPYPNYVGGVLALSREQFETMGGFSNMFFGWGGEDDEMYHRIVHNNYTVFRPQFVRYKMIRHERDKLNERNLVNHRILHASSKKSLENDTYYYSDYRVLTAEARYNGLVYWIEVDVPENRIKKQLMERLTHVSQQKKH